MDYVIIWKSPGRDMKVFGVFTSIKVAAVYLKHWVADPAWASIVKVTEVHGIWKKESAEKTAETIEKIRESVVSVSSPG